MSIDAPGWTIVAGSAVAQLPGNGVRPSGVLRPAMHPPVKDLTGEYFSTSVNVSLAALVGDP